MGAGSTKPASNIYGVYNVYLQKWFVTVAEQTVQIHVHWITSYQVTKVILSGGKLAMLPGMATRGGKGGK